MSSFPSSFNLDTTLGAVLIAGAFSSVLYGLTCVQMYKYFQNSADDRREFRMLMAFLWLWDTFDTVLIWHFLYTDLVSHFNNLLALLDPPWSVKIRPLATSITVVIIRGLYLRRLYRLSWRNVSLTGILAAVSLADFALSIVTTCKVLAMEATTEWFTALKAILYSHIGAGVVADLGTAFALGYLLNRSRTGFERTDGIINVLVAYSINTGLLVALCAIVTLISYVTMPDNFVYLGFYILQSKIYLNSYLGSLNARELLNPKGNRSVSVCLSRYNPGTQDTERSMAREKRNLDIHINTVVESTIDEVWTDSEAGVAI